MRIVLDTNVVVSGLLSPGGPPGRIVDMVTSRALSVVYDDRILAEYRNGLARPRLRIEPVEAAAVLDVIEREGVLVPAPPLAVILPDPTDLPFLEVAAAGMADALVTGNERHFVPLEGECAVHVVSPAVFLSEWRTEAL